jgi:hypothetical protein
VTLPGRRRRQRAQRRTACAGRKATLRAALRADLAARASRPYVSALDGNAVPAGSPKTSARRESMTIIKQRSSLCGTPVVGGLTFSEAVDHAKHAGFATIRTLAGLIPLDEWLPYAEPDWRIFSFSARHRFIIDELAEDGLCSSHFALHR